ncbi:hypothetical protein Ciccas_011351 [Cichlidogyrus casuarinus]|uniref:Uncharacterized protein n=1 Tax=Cichlidogyrus casuarinus TaxID=1844966 RepID=A0ABD2PTJ5_9PLAT
MEDDVLMDIDLDSQKLELRGLNLSLYRANFDDITLKEDLVPFSMSFRQNSFFQPDEYFGDEVFLSSIEPPAAAENSNQELLELFDQTHDPEPQIPQERLQTIDELPLHSSMISTDPFPVLFHSDFCVQLTHSPILMRKRPRTSIIIDAIDLEQDKENCQLTQDKDKENHELQVPSITRGTKTSTHCWSGLS